MPIESSKKEETGRREKSKRKEDLQASLNKEEVGVDGPEGYRKIWKGKKKSRKNVRQWKPLLSKKEGTIKKKPWKIWGKKQVKARQRRETSGGKKRGGGMKSLKSPWRVRSETVDVGGN